MENSKLIINHVVGASRGWLQVLLCEALSVNREKEGFCGTQGNHSSVLNIPLQCEEHYRNNKADSRDSTSNV